MNRDFSVTKVCARLGAAALAWMMSMQLSQILPYIDCVNRICSTAICAAVAAIVALSAAALSWREASLADGRPHRFIGSLAGLTALAITFALMLQLVASLTLNPCER